MDKKTCRSTPLHFYLEIYVQCLKASKVLETVLIRSNYIFYDVGPYVVEIQCGPPMSFCPLHPVLNTPPPPPIVILTKKLIFFHILEMILYIFFYFDVCRVYLSLL